MALRALLCVPVWGWVEFDAFAYAETRVVGCNPSSAFPVSSSMLSRTQNPRVRSFLAGLALELAQPRFALHVRLVAQRVADQLVLLEALELVLQRLGEAPKLASTIGRSRQNRTKPGKENEANEAKLNTRS